MAAPDSTSILNMTGSWSLNYVHSDDLGPTFQLQGIPWIIRKMISYASVEIKMEQEELTPSDNPTTVINVNQTVRPGNFDTVNKYVLDGETRYDTVPIFGAMSMRAHYVSMAEVSEEDLMGHQIERTEATDERIGIKEITKGVNTGWNTTAIWAFEEVNGERRFCKYCTTIKEDGKVQVRLVYDYKPLPT